MSSRAPMIEKYHAAMFTSAASYERFMGRWSAVLARAFVGWAGVRDGEAILDVGSGTGSLAFAVADATKGGSIRGIDPSSDFVRLASSARADTDDRLRFEVGDAQRLPYDDASFDRVLSLLAINFVPDPARALGEMKRVTKGGGTVAAAVWDYGPEGMMMLRTFWDEAIAFDSSWESRDEKHMKLTNEGELAALFRAQGFASVDAGSLSIDLAFASFDDYWEPFTLGIGPAGTLVVGLSEEKRTALAERLRARLGDRPRMSARAWTVRAAC